MNLTDYISPLFGWGSLTAVAVAGLLALAWFIPPLRGYAIMAGGAVLAVMFFFAKGYKSAQQREAEKRERMVNDAQKKFKRIDDRPDDDESVDKKLRDGKF